MDLQVGANFRYYSPRSYGTIFTDTLVNFADTLENGSADRNAEFTKLSLWEMGGYVQGTKRFFENKLVINASARVDKNQNFMINIELIIFVLD